MLNFFLARSLKKRWLQCCDRTIYVTSQYYILSAFTCIRKTGLVGLKSNYPFHVNTFFDYVRSDYDPINTPG